MPSHSPSDSAVLRETLHVPHAALALQRKHYFVKTGIIIDNGGPTLALSANSKGYSDILHCMAL